MRRPAVIAAAAAALLALGAGAVQATTGPTDDLPMPKEVVPTDVATKYVGHWTINEADPKSRIQSGQIALDFTNPPRVYMRGAISLIYYDADGRRSSMIANLYPFTETKGGLRADVLTHGSLLDIGDVTLKTPTDGKRRMEGTIKLDHGTYKVVYFVKPLDDVARAVPPPDTKPLGKGGEPPDPDAKSTAPASEAPDPESDGTEVSNPPADPGSAAAMYAPAVRLAYALADA